MNAQDTNYDAHPLLPASIGFPIVTDLNKRGAKENRHSTGGRTPRQNAGKHNAGELQHIT